MGSSRSERSQGLVPSIEELIDTIETRDGLLEAALCVARFVDPKQDADRAKAVLVGWTERIAAKSSSTTTRALIAHAHAVLFDELGLRGDTEDYYAPENSLLPSVIERRRGLPITLSLVYKLVVEGLGSEEHPEAGPKVEGLGAPGHFLVRVTGDEGFRSMIVDPFHAGRVLSQDEAEQMVRNVVGDEIADRVELLPVVSHRVWLIRIVRNLAAACQERGRTDEAKELTELIGFLAESSGTD